MWGRPSYEKGGTSRNDAVLGRTQAERPEFPQTFGLSSDSFE